MSIVQEGTAPLDPVTVRRGGYALAVVGAVVATVALFAKAPLLAAGDVALAVASAAVILPMPEVFEVNGRRKSRGMNPLFMAPAALVFIAGIQNNFVEVGPLVICALAGAGLAAGAGLLTWRRPGVAGPWQFLILLGLMGAALGYGAPAMLDIRFDASAPRPFRATVNSMFVTHGKSTTYTLRLAPWGPKTQENPVSVSSSLYRQLSPGADVCIALHRGAFGLPWYEVRLCPILAEPVRLD